MKSVVTRALWTGFAALSLSAGALAQVSRQADKDHRAISGGWDNGHHGPCCSGRLAEGIRASRGGGESRRRRWQHRRGRGGQISPRRLPS